MRFSLTLILMLLSLQAFCAPRWQEKVKNILPTPLQEFTPGKTTLNEVEKTLGKPHLIQGTKYYWEFDDFKYALELTFTSQKLQSLHFTFTGQKPSLGILKGAINLKDFNPYPQEGKSIGRFLKLKEKESELIIDPINKTIYSVRLP